MPGPQYDTMTNWKDNLSSHRGLFSKSPRVTFTESILKDKKLAESPGPGAYNTKIMELGYNIRKNKEGLVGKTEKVCAFIEEAQYRAIQTPDCKYEVAFVRLDSSYISCIRIVWTLTKGMFVSTKQITTEWRRSTRTLRSLRPATITWRTLSKRHRLPIWLSSRVTPSLSASLTRYREPRATCQE